MEKRVRLTLGADGKVMKTYSEKLTQDQNTAFARFEGLTRCSPFGMDEFERGEITALQLWQKNVDRIVDAANTAQQFLFPA